MTYFEKALHDPSSVYKIPHDVVVDSSLTRDQKVKILLEWEYDARDIAVAEEENMQGKSSNMLSAVLKALHEIGIDHDVEHSSPTKQGGETE